MDNGHEPATKADVQEVKNDVQAVKNDVQAVKNDLQAVKNDLESGLQAVRDELLEAIRDTETRLLKAFYDFADSNQKRLSATETLGALVVDRLGSIERRVTDIEKRLNTPPAS